MKTDSHQVLKPNNRHSLKDFAKIIKNFVILFLKDYNNNCLGSLDGWM